MTTRNQSRLAGVALLFVPILMAACQKAPEQVAPPPPEVIVQTVEPHATALSADIVADLRAFREVELRPRVSGVVIKQAFKPGQKVKEGDLLFVIDPRASDEALNDAQAKLAEAEAALARSRKDLERYEPLLPKGLVPRQTYDQAAASAKQNEAVVLARKAAVERARLDRSFAEVRSPVSGQVGMQKVEVGGLATAGQTVLATVSTQGSMAAYFSIPETSYLEFARKHEGSGGKEDIPIRLVLADGSVYKHPGQIDFSDRALDSTTGTLTLRAVFPNPEGLLLPGMSTRVRVTYDVAENAILVPQRAVSEMLGKAFLTVIGPDNTAEQRAVSTGPRMGDQWIITKGVQGGERIVIDGLQKARPGVVVKPVTAPPPGAAPQPAPAKP